MRIVITVLMVALMAQMAYAESLKERLRRARQQETEALMPAPAVVDQAAPAEDTSAQKPAVCDQSPKESEGITYYFECACREKKYPDIEPFLKKSGVTYEGVGIKEMGSEFTHLKPEHRLKYRYTCGVSIGWEKDNPVQFKNVKECFAFVEKIKQEAGKTVDVDVGPLYNGCGAHIRKVEKPKAL